MDFFAIINAVLQLSNCNQNAKINHNYESYNYLSSMTIPVYHSTTATGLQAHYCAESGT